MRGTPRFDKDGNPTEYYTTGKGRTHVMSKNSLARARKKGFSIPQEWLDLMVANPIRANKSRTQTPVKTSTSQSATAAVKEDPPKPEVTKISVVDKGRLSSQAIEIMSSFNFCKIQIALVAVGMVGRDQLSVPDLRDAAEALLEESIDNSDNNAVSTHYDKWGLRVINWHNKHIELLHTIEAVAGMHIPPGKTVLREV